MSKFERVLLCSCEDTMQIERETAGAALGDIEVLEARALCMGDLDTATQALTAEGNTLVACGQMSAFFAEIAEEIGAGDRLATVDIRDRAGWTADGSAFSKQAALLAEATLPLPTSPVRDIVSEGTCLVLGTGGVAVPGFSALHGSPPAVPPAPCRPAPPGRTGALDFRARTYIIHFS